MERWKIFLTFTFNGLEDREIKVICNTIEMTPDGSSITVSDFESDMPFVENALNAFAAGAHKLPEGTMSRIGLIAIIQFSVGALQLHLMNN